MSEPNNGGNNQKNTDKMSSSSAYSSGGLIPSQTVNHRTAGGRRTNSKENDGGRKAEEKTASAAGTANDNDKSHRQGQQQQQQPKHQRNNFNGNGPNKNNSKRRRRPGKAAQNNNSNNSAEQKQSQVGVENGNINGSKKQMGMLGRNKGNASNAGNADGLTGVSSVVNSDPSTQPNTKPAANSNNRNNDNNNNKNRRNRQRQNRKKREQLQQKKYPWRKHIPEESVDPITLESLHSLTYPPFALYAEQPYDPIEVWPFRETDNVNNEDVTVVEESEEERQQRILREQWGNQLVIGGAQKNDSDENNNKNMTSSGRTKDRHVHLYDGRALAYYMVSQLQFIDPLNRRDLVRDEIVNLDHYLRRHGFRNLNVTEAYDAKGVTISTAGAAGNTAAGRAAILQQEAAVLLSSLFGGGPTSSTAPPNRSRGARNATSNNSSLLENYQAHENQQQQQQQRRSRQQRQTSQHPQPSQSSQFYEQDDVGIYGDSSGILVIDDDLNPGLRGDNTELRGDAAEFVPSVAVSTPYTTWSSSHIAAQFGFQAQRKAVDFPALAPPPAPESAASNNQNNNSQKKKPLPKSKTLEKIAVSVKKTDPEEREKMCMAHEAWQRRAMMANLTFGVNPVVIDNSLSTSVPHPTTAATTGPSEAQLERNRAFAEALNVKPATLRSQGSGGLKSGWARPTSGQVGDLDEFGKELTTPVYPDDLLLEARDRLPLLEKLERRWKLFLEDDKAASLPLWPMDRSNRAFVHQYSEFWRLKTESFDPEPKRYIHCVKLVETRAPTVLLSTAARNWKGRRPQQYAVVDLGSLPKSSSKSVPLMSDHHLYQTTGQATTQQALASSRWEELKKPPPREDMAPPERPKLDLQKRTLPLELPPFEPSSNNNNNGSSEYFTSEERIARQQQMEDKARREREKLEAKQRALEAAFASDDEEDDDDGHGLVAGDDDSEWTEAEEEYEPESGDEEG